MNVAIVIPARFNSRRLPGKPMASSPAAACSIECGALARRSPASVKSM